MNPETLDRERIERLLVKILEPIRANYHAGPISQARVLEALNALAAATALVIGGAQEQSRGADTQPEEFFRKALSDHLLDFEDE